MLLQAAWSHFNNGKKKDAQEALRKAMAANPDLEVVADFFSPDFMKLVDEVKLANLAAPSTAPVDLAEMKRVAREKLADGNAEDVIHDLTYTVPPERLDAEARELLAAAYEKQGRFTEATKARLAGSGDASKVSVSNVPLSTPVATAVPLPKTAAPADYLALGRSALAHGDALNAQAAANRMLELEPSNSEAYRLLGEAFLARGDRTFGEANLKQSLKYNERNEATLLGLYDFYMADKNWDAALEYLKKATELYPDNREKLLALGRKVRADGDLVHARQVYAVAAAALPNDASVLTEYGVVLLQAKDLDGALEPLMMAAAAEPTREIVRCNLANVLRRKGLIREAEREYRESLRADPDYFPALLGLGTLLLEKESFTDATDVLKKAVARDPRSVEANWALGRAQRLGGNLKDAAETLARARELGSAEIANEAGLVASARGRYSEAAERFDEALGREPSSALYKANRERAAATAKFLADSGTDGDARGEVTPISWTIAGLSASTRRTRPSPLRPGREEAGVPPRGRAARRGVRRGHPHPDLRHRPLPAAARSPTGRPSMQLGEPHGRSRLRGPRRARRRRSLRRG